MRLILLGLLALSANGYAKQVSVTSPDGKLEITLSDEANQPFYSAKFNGQAILDNSSLGLVFKQQASFTEGFAITSSKTNSVNQTWEQPWGERRVVTDKHNEVLIKFENAEQDKAHYSVRVKVFNDGFGFRYEVPKQKGYETVEIVKESTEFALSNAHDTTAYWIPARGWNRYEYTYEESPVFSSSAHSYSCHI